MDSITQMALGGAVGYAIMGKKVGRSAIIWGAALGTLPDLDVLIPYGGEVESFTYHRGFSHSFLVHLLMSPMIAWLITKVQPSEERDNRHYQKGWFWLVFLCLTSHALLDSFTVYGTQLMWPITEYPVGISNLFIIDPLYTLPLLFGLAIASLPKIKSSRAYRLNMLGVIMSSAYICWSLIAKVYINQKVEIALEAKSITASHYVSTPAPFTTLLWRIVVMNGKGYHVGYASVFDTAEEVNFTAYSSDPSLLEDISGAWGVQRLQWFTKGFYSVQQQNGKVILTDLRMGTECNYVFNFAVGDQKASGVELGNYEKESKRPNFSEVGKIWDRIWEPSISIAPNKNGDECPAK